MEYKEVKETFAAMPGLIDPDVVKKLSYIYQFELTSGIWHVIIRNGECIAREGNHNSPTVILKTDDATWLNICNRKTSGLQAVITRKLSVVGNIIIADKLEKIFKFG